MNQHFQVDLPEGHGQENDNPLPDCDGFVPKIAHTRITYMV